MDAVMGFTLTKMGNRHKCLLAEDRHLCLLRQFEKPIEKWGITALLDNSLNQRKPAMVETCAGGWKFSSYEATNFKKSLKSRILYSIAKIWTLRKVFFNLRLFCSFVASVQNL